MICFELKCVKFLKHIVIVVGFVYVHVKHKLKQNKGIYKYVRKGWVGTNYGGSGYISIVRRQS
jgi:hypothetical protein